VGALEIWNFTITDRHRLSTCCVVCVAVTADEVFIVDRMSFIQCIRNVGIHTLLSTNTSSISVGAKSNFPFESFFQAYTSNLIHSSQCKLLTRLLLSGVSHDTRHATSPPIRFHGSRVNAFYVVSHSLFYLVTLNEA